MGNLAYIAQPTSRKKIRQLTTVLRNAFGLSDEEFFPVLHLLEYGLYEIYEEFTFEIVPVEEMPNKYAVTLPEECKIIIREDVYDRAYAGVPRDRFTIAHEVGHFLLHRPGKLALARESSTEKIPAFKNPEWQANTFAGEILAPPHIIRGLNPSEIVKLCGVSLEVAKIQLNNL